MITASAATRPLTQKQESFCLFYFSLKNATEAAKKAGYPAKAAYACGYENLNKPQIQARLAEIADRATPDADKLIAAEIERKRIYSRIARTPLADRDITPDHVIRSIAGLNQMEGVGTRDSILNVTNDNRSITIVVKSEEGKSALEALKGGKLPQLQGKKAE